MMKTFAKRVIAFNRELDFEGTLPPGIRIMNPFRENEFALDASSRFYNKYYNDNNARHLILGINPGRFGAGLTGIPFTDPKRVVEKCGLEFHGPVAHEPSSVFVYEMIDAFGGPEVFYQKFYINSVCPLGFTIADEKGKEVNFNYYDSRELTRSVYGFIVENIEKQISLGIKTAVVFCFGNGHNEKFLQKLNKEHHFFDEVIGLEHPRYIMQYKAKQKDEFVAKYLSAFQLA